MHYYLLCETDNYKAEGDKCGSVLLTDKNTGKDVFFQGDDGYYMREEIDKAENAITPVPLNKLLDILFSEYF